MNSPPNRKRATIVGASSGIGRATALAFAKAGIDVALVGRSQDKLEAVAIAAKEVGVKAKAYSLDLAKLEEVQPKIAAIAADFGGVDILVNSAGIGYTKPLSETTLADWQQVINLNLSSVFQCILGVLPGMRDRANGLIINVASIAAQSPFPGWGAYCASKAGLVAFSKVLAAEERANGIRVANIYPGAVNTPLWDSETVRADFDRAAMLNPDIVARAILYVAQLPAEAVIEEMTVMPSAGTL
ncbi:short-chain dehydrogenase [Hydrococcus rivularis NIES-593]|uniref:Short-chain dehydrogenase n=1 Tax=Hydrococcus rivularis NIES-593 TaxID=1921803 RepID=A0A1U7HE55_9CYAN|nr:SDR family oxidoreductase [Hydrococcus rivularis]OKH21863.1 short-chain dehydrogenase [Hydrococcus rivularis NIES-593]